MADEFDLLVELGEALGYDQATARRFAAGRDGTERQARAAWAASDPAIVRAVGQVVEAARVGLRMSIWEAESHAREVAEMWLSTSAAPVGPRITEVAGALGNYAQALRTGGPAAVHLAESARSATLVRLAESSTTAVTRVAGQPDRWNARLIEGNRWGSSGWYSREVLTRDGGQAFPAGTLVFADHPTATEEADRPERSVRDVAGRIATTPAYSGDGLYAQVEVFPHWAGVVEALAGTIGLSIRASGQAQYGEAAGRQGMIVTSLDEGHSVDFVTRAGAGGKLIGKVGA